MKSPFNVKVAAMVRQHRTRAGISQEAMADQIGISSSSYSQKELGNVGFRVDELQKVGVVLGVRFFAF